MAFGKGLFMESLKTKRAKDGAKDAEVTERLSLRKEEQEKLERWVSELNAKFDGMIRLTKSDLANFLIRHHPIQLSEDEVKLIEAEHFDEMRWLNWAVSKIRDAKKQGLSLTLNDLMQARVQSNSSVIYQKKKRGRRSKHPIEFESVTSSDTEVRKAPRADLTSSDENPNDQNS